MFYILNEVFCSVLKVRKQFLTSISPTPAVGVDNNYEFGIVERCTQRYKVYVRDATRLTQRRQQFHAVHNLVAAFRHSLRQTHHCLIRRGKVASVRFHLGCLAMHLNLATPEK